MGSYECKASTSQYSGSSNGSLIVKDYFKFELAIFPQNIDVHIGGTAIFTCTVYPPAPSQVTLSYTWSRVDQQPISSTATGLNTNELTLVSKNGLLQCEKI